MAIGTGSGLRSSWGRKGFGSHLPRKALGYTDDDSAERSAWEHWFFGTADAPAVPAYFAAFFPDILQPRRWAGLSDAVLPAFQAPEQAAFFAAYYPDLLQPQRGLGQSGAVSPELQPSEQVPYFAAHCPDLQMMLARVPQLPLVVQPVSVQKQDYQGTKPRVLSLAGPVL